jgi:cytochrome P450
MDAPVRCRCSSCAPGRENLYAVYDQLRAAGPLTWTRQGTWACTSYRGCDTVLRDRRFGRSPADDRPGMSFLGMNPPDHTGCGGSRCPPSPRRR